MPSAVCGCFCAAALCLPPLTALARGAEPGPALSPSETHDPAALRLDAASLLAPAPPPFDASRVDPCACGCGVFEVGTASMLPDGPGGRVWLEVDYQDQDRNWSGTSRAPAADNDDKELRTAFATLGFQYMFNRSWGVEAEVPYVFRHFEAAAGAGGGGTASTDWSSVGDIRLRGLYTGFTDDLSAGVSLGLKLPTGAFKQTDPSVDIDRDTQIGSGSTDILLGAFYRHAIGGSHAWTWFAQANADLPVLIQGHYRPGCEFDQAAGVYYAGFSYKGVDIVPIAQVIAAERTSDGGTNSAHPTASGYERLLLSPGVELNFHPLMLYADVEIPLYQRMTGNQLVAPLLFKVIVSYSF